MGTFGEQLKQSMGTAATGAITAGASSLAGGLGDMIFGKYRRKQQQKANEAAAELGFKYNEKAAEEAFRRQKEMFGMVSEYNSPEKMRERLEQAGLSPALMYGGSGAGGAAQAATSAPQGGGAGGVNPVNLSEIKQANTAEMMAQAQIGQMQAQTENIKAQTESTKAGTEKTGAEIDLMKIQGVSEKVKQQYTEAQTEWQVIQNEIGNATKLANMQLVWGDIREQKARTEKMLAETDGQKLDNHIKDEAKEAIITKHNKEVELTQQEIWLKQAQGQLTRKQVEVATAEITDMYANQKIKWDSIDNTKKLIDEMKRHNMRTEGIQDIQNVLRGGEIGMDFIKSLIPWAGRAPQQTGYERTVVSDENGTYTRQRNRYD